MFEQSLYSSSEDYQVNFLVNIFLKLYKTFVEKMNIIIQIMNGILSISEFSILILKLQIDYILK